MKTVLVVVVSGAVYENFAEDLFESAEEYFHPTNEVELLALPGRPGWPEATMYRHHVLSEQMPDADFVFLSDADMLFRSPVWDEVLPTTGLTATRHPGYVGQPRKSLPYETRPQLWSHVPETRGEVYYCGGFVGGTQRAMLGLSRSIAITIDHDVNKGFTPVWHDESALNNLLSFNPPEITLSPSYCYPQNDAYYKTIWKNHYERKLVALDKTEDERGERG